MDERMKFQMNKENLEGLVNRFKTDLGKNDIDLLEYFVKYAKEHILIMEELNRLRDYLNNVYYYESDFDPIEEVIKLLEFKTDSEEDLIEDCKKVKYLKQNNWEHIVSLNNRLKESILTNEEITVKEISDELNQIVEGSK